MSKKQVEKRLIGVVYNADKERARQELPKLERWLRQHEVEPIVSRHVTARLKGVEFVIALGGDGTVLRVAREVALYGLPVLGVNVGHLGFLAATEIGATHRTLARILAGGGQVEERMMLQAAIESKKQMRGPFFALNECALKAASNGRIVCLRTEIRGRHLTNYFGDGLIISTPTGSTAYTLAASGPIVHPGLEVLILCPICPHTLAQRPLIVPAEEEIRVYLEPHDLPAFACLDGQLEIPLHGGDRVIVRRAPERARLLTDPERPFYQLLRTKLLWGER